MSITTGPMGYQDHLLSVQDRGNRLKATAFYKVRGLNMPFQPGQSGNPSGRPAGSVNRKWASMEYWFKVLEANIEHESIKPADKIAIAKWAMELLAGKMKEISSPEESADGAAKALEMLKAMENKPAK